MAWLIVNNGIHKVTLLWIGMVWGTLVTYVCVSVYFCYHILSFITAASVFNSASNPKPPEKNCDSFYNYGCHAIWCSRVEVKYEWLKPTKWCYRRVIDAVFAVSCRRTDIIFDMFLCSLPLKSTLIGLGFFQSVQHWCMKIPRWSTAE